jgi:flagellar hook-length control protein FliK
MKLPGIQNALAALTAANQPGGSKAPAPSANPMRPEQPSFRQALSQEVAQRRHAFQQPAKPQAGARPQQAAAQHAPQQAGRPQPGDKTRQADQADQPEAQAPDETTAATAAPAAPASEAKVDEKPADDKAAGLADIPGAPQAALMMQLMNTAAAPAAPAADAAPPGGAALAGKPVGKEIAGQDPVDLRVVAGKNDTAAGRLPARDAATIDLPAAFGKAMSEAGQQAAPVLNLAQAETPAANTASAALAALQAAVQAAHAPAGHADKLTPAVGTPAWDQALGQKIVWMTRGGEQSATLTMNPPDLGPMQVVLSVSDNQATVDFMSAQPEVRQALESALPRLREMMSESGVQLGQATVSAGSQQQFAGSGGQSGGGRAAGKGGGAIDDSAPQLRQGVVRMARDGAVDTFA